MEDLLIDIDVKNPFLRPSYKLIADCMERKGAAALVHRETEAIHLGRNISRRGYSFGMTKIGSNTWKVKLKPKKKKTKRGMQDDVKGASKEYVTKANMLEKGKKVTLVSRGQAVYVMGLYNKLNSKDKRSFRIKENSKSCLLWLEK